MKNSAKTLVLALVATLTLATPVRSYAADPPISEEARQHFRAGVALLQDPEGARHEEAYREFKAAYAASQSAKVLGNVGFCAMRLERDAEAIEAYDRYLREVPDIDEDEREQIKRDVATMRSGLVRITITSESPQLTVVDQRVPVRGESVTNAYDMPGTRTVLGLRAGHHVLRARRGATQSQAWEVDVMPGGTASHAFVFTPTPTPALGGAPAPLPESKSVVMPWLVTGLGLASLAAGGITGGVALQRTGKLESRCPNDTCPAGYDLEADRSATRRMVTATDILLIGGGVLTVSGLTWLLLSRDPSPTEKAVGVACVGTGCTARVSGAF
ncbi:MAG: hypothetical protein JWM74_239 [Myxococcaceae bacterium]|nr:hypothetical protein [Myxococcaceae bacterium]